MNEKEQLKSTKPIERGELALGITSLEEVDNSEHMKN